MFDFLGLAVVVTAAAFLLIPLLHAAQRHVHADTQPQPAKRMEGWHPDPLARHPRRWWDGSVWTSRVRNGLTESTDSPPPPFAGLT
jgi:hypothetical protein